jgi:hypothetical protein
MRPARANVGTFGKAEPTYPGRRGMSDAANGRGYRQPYGPGRDADDYTHGFLDVIELHDSIRHNA